jgi:GNAT superfamily N-acetyltransferase
MNKLSRNSSFEIRRITPEDWETVLDVYRQCEDFLALGPEPTAAMSMVVKDIETSKNEGGIFCGILATDGKMIGVVDYVPKNFEGDPRTAFLSLLMIAAPFRKQGFGGAIIDWIENEIWKDAQVTAILTAVQINNPQALLFWQKRKYRVISEPELQPDQTITIRLRKDFLPEIQHKDVFGFFRMGLVTGIVDKQAVVTWADSEILQTSSPSHEIIELSLSGNHSYSQLVDLLSQFQGKANYDLPLKLLCAQAGMRLEQEPSQASTLIMGLRLLTAEYFLPGEIRSQLKDLDNWLGLHRQGTISLEELSEHLSRFLEPSKRYRSLAHRIIHP